MAKKPYNPGPPPKEAIKYFQSKGWKAGFDYQDVWEQEHAFAFTAAKAMTADVLETLRGAVEQALAEGRTFRDFSKDLKPELEKLGWWGQSQMPDPQTGELKDVQLGSPRRLQVIYQTNLRTARSAGKWERIQRTKKLLPYLRYSLGPSEVHRPEHVAWEGLELPVDDAWWDSHMPPNGWGCKCWVQQLTKEAVDSTGGPDTAPADDPVEWINPRTGEKEMVPKGVTPGFNFNPGKAREEKQLEIFKDKLNSVSATAADAVHRAWLQPEIFKRWRDNPQGNIPVAVMDEDTQARMGAAQKTIFLSAETMGKQELDEKHPLLTDEDYCLLPDLIKKGEIFKQSDERIVFFRKDGRRFRAAVKTTKNGRENYLVHLQEITKERDYRSAVKKYERIRDEQI